ncbi:hypothetical protein ACHWQZ_G001195 [Mnemiopsis leidyi]
MTSKSALLFPSSANHRSLDFSIASLPHSLLLQPVLQSFRLMQYQTDEILSRAVSSVMILLSLSGIFCNALIISAFIRKPKTVLKRRSQLLLLHLTVADIMLAVAALGHSFITSPVVHSNSTCRATGVLVILLTMVSFFLLVCIGLDRYLAILLPLHYTTLLKSRQRVHMVCFLAWMFPISVNTPFFVIFNVNEKYKKFMCRSEPESTGKCPSPILGYYWWHVMWLPCLTFILSYFYISILLEIRRMKIKFPLLALTMTPSTINHQNKDRLESSFDRSTFTQSPVSSRSSRYSISYSNRSNGNCQRCVSPDDIFTSDISNGAVPIALAEDPPENIPQNVISEDLQKSIQHVLNGHSNILEVSRHLRLPLEGKQLTVKALEIEDKTLKVSYELPAAAEKLVSKHVTKVEINVYTEDNVKQSPVIDHNSSTESLDAAGEKPIPRPMKRRRRITEVTQRKTRKDEKRRMTDPVNYSVYRENLSNASFDNVRTRRLSATSQDSRSSISAFVASLNDLRKGALAHVSGQLTKMAKLKGSLTIALIFIAAVVGYLPRFCASIFDLLQIKVPLQLSIASNIAIAFWPISNSLIYCFRNKEIFTVVFGIGRQSMKRRRRLNTWPAGSDRF